MKVARIYKDNFRENPLFSLFFSDTSPLIFIGGGIAVIFLAFYIFVIHLYNPPFILLSIGLTEMAFFIFSTGKKDNERKYKAIPRQFSFLFTKKQYATKELDTTLSDFQVIGDYIQRKKKLIAVYEIYPYDTTHLGEEARQQFYHFLKLAYHNLSSSLQLITKKQTARIEDYHDHFLSLYKTANAKREKLIEKYHEELEEFIQDHSFQIVKHYAVFSTPLFSEKEKHFAQAVKTLYDSENRFGSSLLQVHIRIRQLEHEELITYCKEQLQ